jgi:phosphomannomutase
MNKEDLSIGSEASGHIILKDFKPYGDGILNVLLILNALHDLGITLEEVYSRIKIIPQALINIYKDELNIDLSNFKNVYSYIRKSGTENCYRVFIQSENEEEFNKCLEYINEYKK